MDMGYGVLPLGEQSRLMDAGCYTSIKELCNAKLSKENKIEYDSDIEFMVSLGDKFRVLDTCGNVKYYILTRYGEDNPHWGVVAKEMRKNYEGLESRFDSTSFPRHNIGFKVISEFPWEK